MNPKPRWELLVHDRANGGMATPTSDREILRDSVPHPERFAALVERHYDVVFAYSARRVGRQIAEDIVAETFTIAFRRRANFRSDHRDARPWLLGIATHLIRRHRRTEVRAYRAYQRLGTPTHLDPQPNDQVGAELAAALAVLSTRQRDVLLLHSLAEQTSDEIAEALDIPVGTVRSSLSRARARAARVLSAGGTPGRGERVKEPREERHE